jgi:hypothetical protein
LSEDESPGNLHAVLAKVQPDVVAVIEQNHRRRYSHGAAPGGRLILEIIADLKARLMAAGEFAAQSP